MEFLRKLGLPILPVPCLHNSNNYRKRKLRVCKAQKCNSLVGANTVPTGTGLQTTPFHTAPYTPTMEFLRRLGLPILTAPCLHPRNNYMKRKLRVCRAQKCNSLVGANTVPTGTGLQTTPFHTAPYTPIMEFLRRLGLPILTAPCLHHSNNYMKMKLRVCRAQKCNL